MLWAALPLLSAIEATTAFADPLTEAQLASVRESERRDRDAANRARNAGRDSIGKGGRHMNHGKHHHNGGEIHQGAFEIAQGILGLLAAAAAEKMANKDDGNGNNLDQITNGTDSGSPSVGGASQSGPANDVSGQGGAAKDSAALDAAGSGSSASSSGQDKAERVDLSSPDAKQAMDAIHEEFGLTADQLVKQLKNGQDVKTVFENAPKNPLTAEQAQAALRASKKGQSDTASSLALNTTDQGGGSQSAGTATLPEAAALPAAAPASAGPQADAAALKRGGGLRDALTRSLGNDPDLSPELSPEVRAAIAAREAEERAQNRASKPSQDEMNLFEVIHQKYREREGNMRWGEPARTAATEL